MTADHLLQLLSPLVNFDTGLESLEALNAAVGLFALILLGLSLSAYRKTRMRRLLVVSAAFGLFAVDVVVRQLDSLVFTIGYQNDQIINSVLELLILLLFFAAVVMKR